VPLEVTRELVRKVRESRPLRQ
jgi:hypothetical protein